MQKNVATNNHSVVKSLKFLWRFHFDKGPPITFHVRVAGGILSC